MKVLKLFPLLCILSLMSMVSWAQVTQDDLIKLTPQQAYKKGMLLRWQYKLTDAKPYLKYAADSGMANAMCMYAVMSNTNMFIQTEDEYKYSLMAAKQDNTCGIARVIASNSIASLEQKIYWRNRLRNIILKPRIKKVMLKLCMRWQLRLLLKMRMMNI